MGGSYSLVGGLPVLLLPFLTNQKRACHPERSARLARVAKDLLLYWPRTQYKVDHDDRDATRVAQNNGGAGRGSLADWFVPRALARAAQQPAQDPTAAFSGPDRRRPIQARPLGENLTLLSGPGGNVVVLHGADGLVVVDTFVAPAWPKLQESLASVGGGAPVKFVINTHWHFDHTDNNAPLHAAGATVVAHANTKAADERAAPPRGARARLPAVTRERPAQRVFTDRYTLEANGERLELSHVPPAHTDTDVTVRFEHTPTCCTRRRVFQRPLPLHRWQHRRPSRRDDRGIEPPAASSRRGHQDRAGPWPLATRADLVKYATCFPLRRTGYGSSRRSANRWRNRSPPNRSPISMATGARGATRATTS